MYRKTSENEGYIRGYRKTSENEGYRGIEKEISGMNWVNVAIGAAQS